MTIPFPAFQNHARPSRLRWLLMFPAALAGLTFATCVFAQGYRFYYNFAPGTSFTETGHSRQTSGGKLISEFRDRIEFQITRETDADNPTVSARILSLSNKGRPVDYYDGVTFQTRFSVRGEASHFAFSGGKPQYRELLQVAGPAKGKDIFWMPVFPDAPMNVGDSFSHTVSVGHAGSRTDYELEEINDTLARFRLRYSGATQVGGGQGTESGEGHAVFDMEKGMWRSHSLKTEGNVPLPGNLSMSYKTTRSKEINSIRGCSRATTGVDNAEEMIDNALSLAESLLDNALTAGNGEDLHWPGTGEDLYAVYRHFHCPTGPQISRIGDYLRRAKEVMADPSFVCVLSSAGICTAGLHGNFQTGSGAGASRWQLVQLCPSFFQLDEHSQAGILIGSAVKTLGVSERQLCGINDLCYFNFMVPAEDVITGNPFAYAYLVRELSGWTPTAHPDRVPCFPSLTDEEIRVRGGAAATDPASVQNESGDVYGILEDLVTGDRFIRHDHLEGADHYLYQESQDGMRMRYYLPSGD